MLPNLGRSPIKCFKHINSDICTRRLNLIGGQEKEEMKLCVMILSVQWYIFNGLEHTTILSHFLTFITGCSSRLLRIRFSADLTMYWFPLRHFRCMQICPLVIWIWNQNIAISTIVGTSSHIITYFVVVCSFLDVQ